MIGWTNLGWLLLLLGAVPVRLWCQRQRRASQIEFDAAEDLPASRSTGRAATVSRVCLMGALFFASLAACGPYAYKLLANNGTTSGRRVLIAMDISGSMATTTDAKAPALPKHWATSFMQAAQQSNSYFSKDKNMRIQVARACAAHFVHARLMRHSGDEMGWMDFDSVARMRQPLDSNLEQCLLIAMFPPGGDGPDSFGEGTNFGGKPDGPIDTASKHFIAVEAETGTSSSNVLVLVTDGENKLEPAVQERLVAVLKAARIRLYIIGIGPALAKQDSGIAKVCEDSGGTVFRVEEGQLEKSFAEVDQLETGLIAVTSTSKHEELFYVPLLLSMLLAVAWQGSEAVLYGR